MLGPFTLLFLRSRRWRGVLAHRFLLLLALSGPSDCGGRTGLLGDGFGEGNAGTVSGATSGAKAGLGAAATGAIGEVSGMMSTGGSVTSAAGSSLV